MLIFIIAFSGCAKQQPATPQKNLSQQPPANGTVHTPLSGSIFGIEYGNIEFFNTKRLDAAKYKETGAKWVKFSEHKSTWGEIEKNPPNGDRHTYDWSAPDKYVKEWQGQEFDIQFVLRAKNSWAGEEIFDRGMLAGFGLVASTPPKKEYEAAYQAWVKAFVERYDGDGIDDMPGLTKGIHYYEIESEGTGRLFWQGTVEEYGNLLKMAYESAHEADPDVRIILNGIGVRDFFMEEGLSMEQREQKIQEFVSKQNPDVKAAFEYGRNFTEEQFAYHQYYDIVEIHELNDYGYRGLGDTVKWIDSEIAKRGGGKKEIWIGDATAAPIFIHGGPLMKYEYNQALMLHYLDVLGKPSDNEFPQINAWYRREQAREAARKYVASMGAGISRVMMCCLEDWPVLSQFPYQGFSGNDLKPRPIFYAYAQLTDNLEGYTDAQKLDSGDKDVYLYRIGMNRSYVLVAWLDDHTGQMADDTLPSRRVSLPVNGTKATVEWLIDEINVTNPKTESYDAVDGEITIDLTETPIFVTPE
ncbi:MAG: hypothetical protein V1861_02005 [Candidatus Micrarchaeota archaeon]